MIRKMNFWTGQSRKSRKSRVRTNRRLGVATLGVESLEVRCMLTANPVLSVPTGQFFGLNAPATEQDVPFRASFTDVVDQSNLLQSYSASINWGDGSPIDTNVAVVPTVQSGFLLPTSAGDPITARVLAYHQYTSTGPFTVTLEVDGTNGGTATQSTLVNVYPVDANVHLGANGTQENADEGSLFTLSLDGSGGINQNISSWTINWGDSIDTLPGNPSSATHVFGDDDNYGNPATFNHMAVIGAKVTGEHGTFVVQDTNQTQIHNVPAMVTVTAASDVNEGQPYVLNLSYTDPGDANQGWIIAWGDEVDPQTIFDFTLLPGNATSVQHVYTNGDASYSVFAISDNDSGDQAFEILNVNVHNVVPTIDDTTLLVPEHTANGTAVGTPLLTNPANDALTFTVLSGNEAGAFAVNATTGEITVANSSLLEVATHPTYSLLVEVSDGEGGVDTATVTINVTKQANISGVVYVDVNHNGLFNANEPGIDGVTVKLLHADGTPVLDGLGQAITSVTSNGGLYLFAGLQPGTYDVFEQQPTGVTDGAEQLGTLGGTIVSNDRMRINLGGVDAFDYAFAELGQQLKSGDTAAIGFWQNKTGQALIAQGGTQLAPWLTANFGNIFGNTLVGMTGSQVASFYRDQVFKGMVKGGTPKVDAQFMATAFATFFTSKTLAGLVAASYGFNVTDTGIGTKIVNVGTKGAAFGVANGTDRTILELLLATNNLTDQANASNAYVAVYDANGNGAISTTEASLRSLASDLYGSINGV